MYMAYQHWTKLCPGVVQYILVCRLRSYLRHRCRVPSRFGCRERIYNFPWILWTTTCSLVLVVVYWFTVDLEMRRRSARRCTRVLHGEPPPHLHFRFTERWGMYSMRSRELCCNIAVHQWQWLGIHPASGKIPFQMDSNADKECTLFVGGAIAVIDSIHFPLWLPNRTSLQTVNMVYPVTPTP
ncbi:hypothetical protein EDC04DRAFT_1136835 [Pisolithus marmoratus]|nr:hypothetical protein EDC04DRAFT_1136835 [Pisolithus marmoratus]